MLATNTASAEVFRCTVDGRVVFQETPCEPAPRAPNVAAPVNQQQSKEAAEQQKLREQADKRRAEESQRRDQLQRKFVDAGPEKGQSGAPTPPLTFNPRNPCEIRDFFERMKAVELWTPSMAPIIKKVYDKGRYQVGMPHVLFQAMSCNMIRDSNRTATAAGESIQYVMNDTPLFYARYVYVKNNVVTAVQD